MHSTPVLDTLMQNQDAFIGGELEYEYSVPLDCPTGKTIRFTVRGRIKNLVITDSQILICCCWEAKRNDAFTNDQWLLGNVSETWHAITPDRDALFILNGHSFQVLREDGCPPVIRLYLRGSPELLTRAQVSLDALPQFMRTDALLQQI